MPRQLRFVAVVAYSLATTATNRPQLSECLPEGDALRTLRLTNVTLKTHVLDDVVLLLNVSRVGHH